MYICMYMCVYICIYARICVYICIYACICVYICIYACICVYMYICMYMCVYICIYACICVCMYVFIYSLFQSSFSSRAKLKGKVQRFPIYPLPLHRHSLPHITIPHQSGTFVKTGEPPWTHHYHPKAVVYITVHFWCCTFCVFRQVYNDM